MISAVRSRLRSSDGLGVRGPDANTAMLGWLGDCWSASSSVDWPSRTEVRPTEPSTPKNRWIRGIRRSHPMMATFTPASANATARFAVIDDLPWLRSAW